MEIDNINNSFCIINSGILSSLFINITFFGKPLSFPAVSYSILAWLKYFSCSRLQTILFVDFFLNGRLFEAILLQIGILFLLLCVKQNSFVFKVKGDI